MNTPKINRGHLPEVTVDELPSKFKAYPVKSTVTYQPYMFGEVKKLAGSNMSEEDQLKFILEGIYTSFPKMDLTMSDLIYLSILRKISSFGSEKFTVMTYCDNRVGGKVCGTRDSFVMQTDQIEFEELNVPATPVVASIGGAELWFMPLTVGRYLEALSKPNGKEDQINLFVGLVNLREGMDWDSTYVRFYSATGSDLALLEQIDEMLYHGVKPIVHKCPKCGEESKIEIESEDVLLRPFRESKVNVGGGIFFGIPPSFVTSGDTAVGLRGSNVSERPVEQGSPRGSKTP